MGGWLQDLKWVAEIVVTGWDWWMVRDPAFFIPRTLFALSPFSCLFDVLPSVILPLSEVTILKWRQSQLTDGVEELNECNAVLMATTDCKSSKARRLQRSRTGSQNSRQY